MDDKFNTKDYPSSRDYPQSKDIPVLEPRAKNYAASPEAAALPPKKKQNAFVRFLKFVFVKNIGIKLAAILTAGAVFLLGAGF